MLTLLPTHLGNWGDSVEPRLLEWAEEETLDCYFVAWFRYLWVDGQTSRCGLFEEDNLMQARRRVRSKIESFNLLEENLESEACCEDHDGPEDLLREMDDILSAFLELPVTPLPDLPYELVRQIITWAIQMNYDIRWTLISKDALSWAEPIIFESIDTFFCPIFFPKVISPRCENAGTLVKEIVVSGDPEHQSEDYVRLLNRLRNLRILSLHEGGGSTFPQPFPQPHPTLPYLARLDCPLAFGVGGRDGISQPDFSQPLFSNLTHIDIYLSLSSEEMISGGWQWSFESMTRLQFIRFYKYADFDSLYSYFLQHILPRFPVSLRGCLICEERASQATVDAFLALDPRLVWGFESEEVPPDAECRMLARARNRVVMYNSMTCDTDIAWDGWSEEMVEAIENDKLLCMAGNPG
ncbi:hypothetical protein DL96DRAFT_1818672 [Flagelloscypha sp. PMI_526]|nr:hypothetical protein DL96DRAFT_1818672 [Flagelloscypha sp. PMI_526]